MAFKKLSGCEGNTSMGIPGNTFGSSKLHSKFDQNINITPILHFDVDDECGRDKERYIPKTYCEVQTMGCFIIASTHFEASVNYHPIEEDKE